MHDMHDVTPKPLNQNTMWDGMYDATPKPLNP